MSVIQPPDIHHLSAAVGWLELGNREEAKAELSQIAEKLGEHPDVLEVKWAIAAHEKNWPEALKLARTIVAKYPLRPSGWLHQAYAIRRVEGGGLQPAWDALFAVAENFPDHAVIPYNLACYACQLGKLDEARRLLKVAIGLCGKGEIKKMALNDEDLKPLWAEIAQRNF